MSNPAARILYCHCAYAKVVPDAVKHEVLTRLAESGEAFEAVADLCEMSARRDPALKQLIEDRPVRIAACYPRAVKWLFNAANAPLPAEGGVDVCNMRTATAEQVVGMLLGGVPIPADEPAPQNEPAPQPPPVAAPQLEPVSPAEPHPQPVTSSQVEPTVHVERQPQVGPGRPVDPAAQLESIPQEVVA